MAPASTIQGAAAYKKKDGTLSIAKDQKSIQWLPVGARDAEKAVTIPVVNISSKWYAEELLWASANPW